MAGYQILLNYRDSPVQQVSVTQVLDGEVNLGKDKIVIVGITAPSAADNFFTPYSASQWPYQETPAVLIQAQMVSQILSAVLDGRKLLWVMPFGGEVVWIWGWSLMGGLLVGKVRSLKWQLVAIGVGLTILYMVGLGLLILGVLLPVVPAALAGAGTSVIVKRQRAEGRRAEGKKEERRLSKS